MELADRITNRAAELTGEVEVLRKQLADAEYELERGAPISISSVCTGRPDDTCGS